MKKLSLVLVVALLTGPAPASAGDDPDLDHFADHLRTLSIPQLQERLQEEIQESERCKIEMMVYVTWLSHNMGFRGGQLARTTVFGDQIGSYWFPQSPSEEWKREHEGEIEACLARRRQYLAVIKKELLRRYNGVITKKEKPDADKLKGDIAGQQSALNQLRDDFNRYKKLFAIRAPKKPDEAEAAWGKKALESFAHEVKKNKRLQDLIAEIRKERQAAAKKKAEAGKKPDDAAKPGSPGKSEGGGSSGRGK